MSDTRREAEPVLRAAAYFVGVFGPAVIEVALLRIRSFRAGPGGGPDA